MTLRSEVRIPLQTIFLTGCSFTGGCMIGALFMIAGRCAKAIVWSVATLCVVGLLFWFCLPLADGLGGNRPPSVCKEVSSPRLASCSWRSRFGDFWKSRDADSLLLLLWIAGTFVFATFLNWSITARTVLPMTPAIFILLTRHSDRREGAQPKLSTKLGWITVAALVSMIISGAAASQAGAARAGARYFRETFAQSHARVWFQSHWGFQWYMQQWKAKPVVQGARFRPNDLLIVPSDNADALSLPESAIPLDEISRPITPFVSTFAPNTGAGFYSSVRRSGSLGHCAHRAGTISGFTFRWSHGRLDAALVER